MILRSIELEQFGKFRGRTFEFRRGMNLVTGPNEAGKSTLAEAIPAVLFGTATVERFKPWGRGNACSAALIFEGEGRTVEVRRNLLTDEVRLVERDDLYHTLNEFSGRVPFRGRSSLSQEYRALLERLIGVAEEDLFRATYFFGQNLKEWTGDSLAKKLRTLVTGAAETDYAAILDGLLEEHFELTCENPWGRNKQRERELEVITRQLSELDDEAAAPSEPAGVDPELVEQVKVLEEQLEKDRLEYQKGVRYVDKFRVALNEQASAKNDRQQQQQQQQQQQKQQQQQQSVVVDKSAVDLAPLRNELKALGLPDVLPKNLTQILSEAAQIRQELAQSHQPLAKLKQSEKRVPAVPWGMVIVLTAVMAVLGGVAWWLDSLALPASAATGLVALSAWGWAGWRQLQRKKALAEIASQLTRLEQQRATILARQAELTERCEALGLPSSPIALVKLQKLVDRNKELLEPLSSPAAPEPVAQTAVNDDVTAEEPDEIADVVEDDVVEDDVVEDDVVEDDDGQRKELAELEQRLAEFAEQLEGREQELNSLRDQLPGRGQGPAALSGGPQAVALREQKDRIEERIAILRMSVGLLAGAIEAFGQSHLSSLVDEAGRLFGKMTSGRYKQLRLDAEMRPELRVDERRWVAADRFSRGTVDALYLALRVALARERGDGRSLPLLLDDPFVHLDQKRLRAALNTIDLAAAEGQLIIMSHQQDLAKRAARERWHVVSLGEEHAGAEEGEDEENAGQLHLL